ncbi:MAG: tRNA pseudouridine(55) synthase TruB [Clostridiales bacterium]|jgi:tRNA pseudouridine55 synthase|nr:tRNA pseudouridine(55) synthase TruB [Clostridiales bacterium]
MTNFILNVNKESGMSSHQVVQNIKKITNVKKVGHTGTLDPLASGVLVVCLGKATKISNFIMNEDKEYIASFKLGITTDTEDSTGKILESKHVNINKKIIEEAVQNFTGIIEQTPPMYSALKVNGKKLYELARKGIEIERKSRKVKIYEISVLNICFIKNEIFIKIKCSKGTYIRTLCADIGKFIGCGAHLTSLVRTKNGKFCIENSLNIKELKNNCNTGDFQNCITSIDEILCNYQKIFLTEIEEIKIKKGISIELRNLKPNKFYVLYSLKNKLLSLSTVTNEGLYKKIINFF